MTSPAADLRSQADLCFAEANYAEAAIAYEQAIELEPEELSHYWQLGLALFLQGEAEEGTVCLDVALTGGRTRGVRSAIAKPIKLFADAGASAQPCRTVRSSRADRTDLPGAGSRGCESAAVRCQLDATDGRYRLAAGKYSAGRTLFRSIARGDRQSAVYPSDPVGADVHLRQLEAVLAKLPNAQAVAF